MPANWYATSPLPMLLDDVVCSGRELQLGECEYVTENNCSQEEELGIVCSGGWSAGGGLGVGGMRMGGG